MLFAINAIDMPDKETPCTRGTAVGETQDSREMISAVSLQAYNGRNTARKSDEVTIIKHPCHHRLRLKFAMFARLKEFHHSHTDEAGDPQSSPHGGTSV